jgi:predicted secreted protein
MRKSVIYLAVVASLVSAKASACDHAIVLRSSEKLQKIVNEAGKQSWSALTTAMAETRAAFDRANKAVHDAFNRRA